MTIPRDPEVWSTSPTLVCAACGEFQAIQDVTEAGDGTPLSECHGEPCRLPPKTQPTLEHERGPAWASFVAAPRVLLAARFTYEHRGKPREINASSKLVAIELLDWLHLPAIYPSHETLAERVGVSERTVRRALGELERAGLIGRTRRHGPKGARRPDLLDLAPLVAAINALAANPAVGTLDGSPNGQVVQGVAAKLAADLPANLAEELEEERLRTEDEIERAGLRGKRANPAPSSPREDW